MKANEAPEKIYLVPFGRPIIEPIPKEGGSDVETIWSKSPYGNKEAGNFEYTRTDAFVDKACSWLENNLQGIVGGSIYIEDFRKYMEGD